MYNNTHPEDSPNRRKGIKTAAFAVFSFFLLICFTVFVWLNTYSERKGPVGPGLQVVDIPRGSSVKDIASILGRAGVIDYDRRFEILVRLHGYSDKLRAGEFELKTGLKPVEVMKALSVARPKLHSVTIAEGLSGKEIGALLSSQNWCEKDLFNDLIHNQDLLSKYSLSDLDSLEGYLFPDTYAFTKYPVLSCQDIISMMVQRFFEVTKHLELAGDQLHKVVTLASIVEKETGKENERTLIAGVFTNRLRKGMRLQADPTVIYGIPDFTGNLTKTHLRAPTPYNTYVIKGLPKGPICNPGLQSIEAVLKPEGDYLYFVSKNDGTHYFSKNLREHNRAVRKYQKRRKKVE